MQGEAGDDGRLRSPGVRGVESSSGSVWKVEPGGTEALMMGTVSELCASTFQALLCPPVQPAAPPVPAPATGERSANYTHSAIHSQHTSLLRALWRGER